MMRQVVVENTCKALPDTKICNNNVRQEAQKFMAAKIAVFSMTEKFDEIDILSIYNTVNAME